jgi:hypothetical protein
MNDAQLQETVEDAPETDEVETELVEDTEEAEEATGEAEAEPAESSTEKTEDEVKAEPDKVQKRIDEITKYRREEERQRIVAEDEVKVLREQLDALTPKQPAGMSLADFEYDEGKFSEYLGNQANERATAAVHQRMDIEKRQQQQAEFSVRESDYSSDFDDYHAVTRSNDLKLSQDMVNVAQGSEHGPAILYHLGKNPDVSERLSRMAPMDMARELGKIEATQLAKPPSITKAPAPPAKLKGTDKATTIRSDSPASDSLSTEEWRRREHKRMANRNK